MKCHMTIWTIPISEISIRKYFISRQFVFITPQSGDIRKFSSKSVISRCNYAVITIRTVSITIYHINDFSIVIIMASRA